MAETKIRKYLRKFDQLFRGKRTGKQEKDRPKKLYGLFLAFLFVVTGAILLPGETTFQYSDYKVGVIAREEIIAPATFPIRKTDAEIDVERREASNSVLAQFFRDTEAEQQSQENINQFFNLLADYRQQYTYQQSLLQESRNEQAEVDSTLLAMIESRSARLEGMSDRFRQNYNIDVDFSHWDFIKEMDPESYSRFRTDCVQIMKDIVAIGIVNVPTLRSAFEGIELILNESEGISTTRRISEFSDTETVQEQISLRLRSYYSYPSDTTNVGFEVIQSFIIPNIKYDPEATENLRRDAVARVAPSRGFVQQNEKIIDQFERVSEDHYRKIESLRIFLTEQGMLQSRFSQVMMYLGQAVFLIILIAFFCVYLWQYRPKILKNTRSLSMIFLVFIFQLLFIFLITQQFGLSEYMVPTTIASMLLAILFDGGIGFYGTIVLAFIIGGFQGHEFVVTMFTLAGGVAAVLSVRKIRTRNQFFKSILYIFVAYALVLYSTGIMRMMSLSDISLMVMQYALPNAIFAPLITLGFLAFFESVFNSATDMTLLELSDLNRPLLRELAMRAPGTYHHSILLGNLSERAAEAIGANSLLARVGCYYHDIGKMEKPEYFIENRPEAREKHESLAPSMSALIISSHVRDGLEIAKKYKLPTEIQDFIEQHHGTSMISFFYTKAVEKSGEKYVIESDFRYPGPKPQTKETGIVMLADGVEAATRALKEPSSTRIRERVRSIVESKFQEGQLDECELTMRELAAISESFIQILTGIFHVRIEYPGQDEDKSQQTEEKIIEQSD